MLCKKSRTHSSFPRLYKLPPEDIMARNHSPHSTFGTLRHARHRLDLNAFRGKLLEDRQGLLAPGPSTSWACANDDGALKRR